jgi:hypothetical protein
MRSFEELFERHLEIVITTFYFLVCFKGCLIHCLHNFYAMDLFHLSVIDDMNLLGTFMIVTIFAVAIEKVNSVLHYLGKIILFVFVVTTLIINYKSGYLIYLNLEIALLDIVVIIFSHKPLMKMRFVISKGWKAYVVVLPILLRIISFLPIIFLFNFLEKSI